MNKSVIVMFLSMVFISQKSAGGLIMSSPGKIIRTNPTDTPPTTPIPASAPQFIGVKSTEVIDNPVKSVQNSQRTQAINSHCPNGYISVPPLAPYTTQEFCVMKYEAKDDGNKKPISKASGVPWIFIDRANAILKCRSVGRGFDLISNDQWQTIARNIAGVAANWSGNKVATGELNRGISDRMVNPIVDTNTVYDKVESGEFKIEQSYNALPAFEDNPKEPWSSQRRTHFLSNGNMIWDFAGNVSEYVSSDAVAFSDPEVIAKGLREKDQISFMNAGDIYQINYGAATNTICVSPHKFPYCGMGHANLPLFRDKKTQAEISYEYCAENFSKKSPQAIYICGAHNTNFPPVQSWKAIHRGGSNGYGVHTGIFSVDIQGPLSSKVGFRCVYVP